MKELKKEVLEMEHQIEEIKQEEKSLAYELIEMQKHQNKRLFIIVIILIILLFSSNLAWLCYEMSFETISEYEEQIIEDVDASTITQTMN